MLEDRWVDAGTAEQLGIQANENPNAPYPRLSYGGEATTTNKNRLSGCATAVICVSRIWTLDTPYPKNSLHDTACQMSVSL